MALTSPEPHAPPADLAPQSVAPLAVPAAVVRRRVLFFTLVGLSSAGLLGLMAYTLSAGGLDWVDALILLAYALTLPWSALGLVNAGLGFVLMAFARDPLKAASPISRLGDTPAPITSRVAIAICVRNEEPARLARNLGAMLADLAASDLAGHGAVFILSDTNRPEIATAEEEVAHALSQRHGGRLPVIYRRRIENPGFKAGNIRDFCANWGEDYDFIVVLDADSYMSAAAVLRLVRVMQADDKLGIVQSLVVGLPSTSLFARIFQFGMRLGMRSYTLGSAFWQADCGPYWGHNAIVRLKPFIDHCELPLLAGGRHILSHDQIEAALMRRAGYEVRALPIEDGSWEENPPTLLEFMRRDLRWYEGNMQYRQLLGLPGLRPVSRFQLAFAILMFAGSPAWVAMFALLALHGPLTGDAGPVLRPDTAPWLLGLILITIFAPKIAGALHVLRHRDERRAFGGTARFLGNLAVETLFTAILSPIMTVTHTLHLGVFSLGRSLGWGVQARDDHAVPFAAAAARLWPHTLVGLVAALLFAQASWSALLWALPAIGGLLLAMPFAVLTSHPALGLWAARAGVGRLPEETAPPPALAALDLPTLRAQPRPTSRTADAVP